MGAHIPRFVRLHKKSSSEHTARQPAARRSHEAFIAHPPTLLNHLQWRSNNTHHIKNNNSAFFCGREPNGTHKYTVRATSDVMAGGTYTYHLTFADIVNYIRQYKPISNGCGALNGSEKIAVYVYPVSNCARFNDYHQTAKCFALQPCC